MLPQGRCRAGAAAFARERRFTEQHMLSCGLLIIAAHESASLCRATGSQGGEQEAHEKPRSVRVSDSPISCERADAAAPTSAAIAARHLAKDVPQDTLRLGSSDPLASASAEAHSRALCENHIPVTCILARGLDPAKAVQSPAPAAHARTPLGHIQQQACGPDGRVEFRSRASKPLPSPLIAQRSKTSPGVQASHLRLAEIRPASPAQACAALHRLLSSPFRAPSAICDNDLGRHCAPASSPPMPAGSCHWPLPYRPLRRNPAVCFLVPGLMLERMACRSTVSS